MSNKFVSFQKCFVSLKRAMETDYDLYNIKRLPLLYFYKIVKFAADILFVLKAKELDSDIRSKREFEKASYLWWSSDICEDPRPEALGLIASEVLGLQSELSRQCYSGVVTYGRWDSKSLRDHYKIVAKLELYGAIVQSPQLLKLLPKGEVDISFLSSWSRRVIKRVNYSYYQKKFTLYISYGLFCERKRKYLKEAEPIGQKTEVLQSSKVVEDYKRRRK